MDQHTAKCVDKDLWTMKDTASFLDVSMRTLGKWVDEGNIDKIVIDNGPKRVYIHVGAAHLLGELDQNRRKRRQNNP